MAESRFTSIRKYGKPFSKKINQVSDNTNIKFIAKINSSIRADAYIIKGKAKRF